MGRRERIDKELKAFDPLLFCERREGTLCVLRKGYRWEPYALDNDAFLFLRPSNHFVFALTDNWRTDGKPVDWGLIPIINRLKAIDLWQRDLAGECEQQSDKWTDDFNKDRKNSIESFMYDFRRQFKKTFNDVNVGNLAKKDNRQKREAKNGNY